MSIAGLVGTLLKCIPPLHERWRTWKDRQLTEREKEILAKALTANGEILVIRAQPGEFVCVGDEEYLDKNDPSRRSPALETLRKLESRGLVVREGEQRYHLSGSGFDTARKTRKLPSTKAVGSRSIGR